MRVALVHDWLTGLRGGERVLDRIAAMFPGADLFTLVHVPGATTSRIDALRITASPLSRIPGAGRHYRKALPLFPWAIGRFDLRGYDLVLSTSHAVAKSVRSGPAQPHLSYCFTPMRYVWDQADAYLGRGLRRAAAAPLVASLRRFDRATAGRDRVTRFVAISRCVAERIERHYGRRAHVVHPPVEVSRFGIGPAPRDDFYLMVGGFVAYKREALAIEAFRGGRRRLLIAGDGPLRRRLERRAPPQVQFTGRLPDAELAGLMRRARALVHPQEEDFGIAAVEAQACGTPVLAFAAGGALDTVRPLGGDAPPTGLYFDEASPAALRAAIERFECEATAFDPQAIRAHALRFGPERFEQALRAQVEATLREAGGGG